MEPIRDIITLLEEKSKPQDLEIVKLNYGEGGLSPVMTAATVRYHWGKLAHAYADRYNKSEGDRQFNYDGATLHNLLFTQFRAPRNKNEPNGPIGNMIKTKFKSWDNFKEQFKEEALKLQGSGWVYLARNGDIKTIHNHGMRQDILILVDMWEHAYNMEYGTNKAKYIDNIWRIFDWNVINMRWGQGYKK
jgi:Fe-Mn family superoxide dismutase